MPKILQVEGRPDLVRDTATGAIINKNKDEYHAWMAQQAARQDREDKINKLEAEMMEIKNLLKQLINKE